MNSSSDQQAAKCLKNLAAEQGLQVSGGRIRRTSSRFCLGVEHGDYNGTELFGVGTDRFIWLGYKPNDSGTIRLYSGNFADDGIVSFRPEQVPPPRTVHDSWARFPYGVVHILRKEGFDVSRGFDAVLYGNIPGGGMSRSASLTLNLILTLFEVNGIEGVDDFKIIDMAQAVENEYIGSPCGQLDQIMIYFARAGMGTHYQPATRSIEYVPLGAGALDFRIVSMDTGTVRPGLEKSTYKVRRAECEQLVKLAQEKKFAIRSLADVKQDELYQKLLRAFQPNHPHLCRRLTYIYKAQQRFYEMLAAWKAGDVEKIGSIFRADGIGLRDDYAISGPELETMCDIARTVEGVLGERMLGGGDKGAAGAIVRAEAVEPLQQAVAAGYPRSHPDYADKFAVHICTVTDGIKVFDDLL
ncbi:MAG: Galactokinase [Planctomycetes bacterium ADurb.Bin412]|nr:MAG: Galactokinase [Planctomycetes bacterium ADurb.Bin412]